MSPPSIARTGTQVFDDLREFVSDAEKLLRATAEYSSENIASARTRLQDGLEHARTAISEAAACAVDDSRKALQGTDRLVRQNPWTTLAVGFGIGLVLGLIGGRR